MPVASAPGKAAANTIDHRKLLVERLASSSYLNKSVRLRDMFLYVCERVLDHSVAVIHEQEVGHKVFGRSSDYDTNADNIVRVHASTLRKRIEQYFANEGSQEPVVIDIPRGNYAPVFRKRVVPSPVPLPEPPHTSPTVVPAIARDWRLAVLMALSAILGVSTLLSLWRVRSLERSDTTALASNAVIRQFWSSMFAGEKPTDIVLDDAALGYFQELTGQQIRLSEYFDRSYVRSVQDNAAKTPLGRSGAEALILKRQSSYADASLLWKLAQIAGALHNTPRLHFARDYSFRELKADNAILLGNSRSNPWIEPFESHVSLQWRFDAAQGTFYPVDTTRSGADENKFDATSQAGEPREGYATIFLLPNLTGTGKVLIISGTGGAAVGTALDFLSDPGSLVHLRSQLPHTKSPDFPYFEALLRVKSRSTLPRDTMILTARAPRG
ncbi:MAG TPA: hypothetical protein VM912_18010 [Terriglobales bacterium]|nr:hypothetical protein [Terriglobales bacterium]